MPTYFGFRPCLQSTLIWILLGIGLPAAAQEPAVATPAAPAAAAAKDAFGQPVDVAAQLREQLGNQITAVMGSADWVPLGLKMLESHGDILGRLNKSAEIDLQCMRRYRQENPEKTREDFRAFIASAAGPPWQKACIVDLLSGPQPEPQLVDGMVASIEVGMMLPNFLNAVRKSRQNQGLPDVPELTPELEAKLPSMVAEGFAMSGCLMTEVLKKVPIGKVVADSTSIVPVVQEVVGAGKCGFPAPKTAAPPTDPS